MIILVIVFVSLMLKYFSINLHFSIARFPKKAYKQSLSDQQRLQLEVELSSRGFDGSETKINLLLRGAVFRQVPGCIFFTATTACKKMINGVSGTISHLRLEGHNRARLLPRMRETSYLSSAALASQSFKAFNHCSVAGLPNVFSITTTK